MARCLAVFCLLALPLPAGAAAPLMALPGQWNVDPMGGFTYTLPIEAPPGTDGMVPHIALSYSSRGGDGYVGYGWSISGLSTIRRCAQTYAQDGKHGGVNYDANDRFCLDGQRLILVSGSYGANGSQYRTEVESFRKIVFHTTGSNCGVSCFDVWTKDGTDYQYGYTENSNGNASGAQILAYDTNNNPPAIVRLWALNQVTDTKGNFIDYTYADIDNYADYVPTRIDFTGNSATGSSTYNSIQFSYEDLSQVSTLVKTYQAGYLIEPQRLLTAITTHHLGPQILNYALTSHPSRLRE